MSTEAFDRPPPHNLEAEQCVIGSMLIDNAVIPEMLDILTPESFWRDAHQKLFAGIQYLYEAGGRVDSVLVFEELVRSNQIVERELDHAYIGDILDRLPTAANAAYYAKIVRQKAIARRVIHLATQLANKANGGNADDLLADVDDLVSGLLRSAESSASVTLEAAALQYVESLRQPDLRFIPSGIEDLDECIDGIAPGNLFIVGARPSHGKSAFALQWLDHAASLGFAGLLITEEMETEEVGKRAVNWSASVIEDSWSDATEIITNDLRDHFKGRARVHIEGPCGTIDKAVRTINRYCERGVKIVAVDYIQLLGGKGLRKIDEVTDVSRKLKLAARRNKCAIIALSQLNRQSESRDSRLPMMSDLRESGAIEQDADCVILLQWPHRLEYTRDEKRPPEDEYRIIVGKRRNGPIRPTAPGRAPGRIVVRFRPDRQRFASMIHTAEESPVPF